jgi:hypothetical protein
MIPKIYVHVNYKPIFVAAFLARLLTMKTTAKAVIAAKVDVQGVEACISAILSFFPPNDEALGEGTYPLPGYEMDASSR